MRKTYSRTLAAFTAVENTVIDDSRLTREALLAYLALARHADNETRTAYPSLRTLAKVAGIDLRKVVAGIRCLEKHLYLFARRRPGVATHYTLGPRVEPEEDYQLRDRSRVNRSKKPRGVPFAKKTDHRRYKGKNRQGST